MSQPKTEQQAVEITFESQPTEKQEVEITFESPEKQGRHPHLRLIGSKSSFITVFIIRTFIILLNISYYVS